MSSSRLVPASVPSVTHSSGPVVAGSVPLATRTARPSPSAAMPLPAPLFTPGAMSFSRLVPTAVPSVTQNSLPWLASCAEKSARPLPSEVTKLG